MNIVKVSGVPKYYQFEDPPIDRVIYFVGEEHGKRKCPLRHTFYSINYPEFYDRVLTQNDESKSPKFIDLYFEDIAGTFNRNTIHLNIFRNKIKNCIHPWKPAIQYCPYGKNTRIHWNDTRMATAIYDEYFNSEYEEESPATQQLLDLHIYFQIVFLVYHTPLQYYEFHLYRYYHFFFLKKN